MQPDHRFHCFPLRKVITERRQRAIGFLDHMLGLEPPDQERVRGLRGAGVASIPPRRDLTTYLGDQGRQ